MQIMHFNSAGSLSVKSVGAVGGDVSSGWRNSSILDVVVE